MPHQVTQGIRVRIAMYKVNEVLPNALASYETNLWDDQLPRQIPDYLKIKKAAVKTWLINPKDFNHDTKLDVNLYLPFKSGKKVRYNEDPSTPGACSLNDFVKERWLLSMRSDVPLPPGGISQPPTSVQYQSYPHFYGNFTCYYRDA